jgi:4-carboxymuconolactone decarboxylase
MTKPRLPPIPQAALSPEQAQVAAAIIAGPRQSLGGPFQAWLRSPALADRLQKLGEYVRFDNVLPRHLSEFAILITARHWTAQYEWYAHRRLALAAGLDPALADAVAENRRPETMRDDERAIYGFATELHRTGGVSDAAYDDVQARFGEQGVIDLIGICGYYTIVAMTLNVAEVPIPNAATPLKPIDHAGVG